MTKDTLSKPKYYVPRKDLMDFITKRLQFERMAIQKTSAGERLSDEDLKLQKSLATRKTRILDKFFQEFADVTFLVESIAAHKELQELFDNDLKDLLGLRQEVQQSKALDHGKPYPIFFKPDTFRRLVQAVLAVDNKKDKSFRLSLPYVLQEIIYSKIERQKPDLSKEIADIMLTDIRRAVAWTKLYASGAEKDDDLGYHRALGYTFRPIHSSRSYTDEIDQYSRIL